MAVDFGYSISVSRAIDLDRMPNDAARRLTDAVPSLAGCVGCGSCTASCTTGAIVDFNPRVQQTLRRRGVSEINTEQCMLCGKCRQVCPRRVDTRRIMISFYDERLLF